MSETYMTAERTGDKVAVYVGEGFDNQPVKVWEAETDRVSLALDQMKRETFPRMWGHDPGPRIGAPGEVRRCNLQGTFAVKVNDRPSGSSGNNNWRVIGHDPNPFGYGWRDDGHVRDWEIVGNSIEQFLSRKDNDR